MRLEEIKFIVGVIIMVTLRTGDRCLFENTQDEVFRLQGEGYEVVMKTNAVVIMVSLYLLPSRVFNLNLQIPLCSQ